jgi:membrane protease YdiL (CAAX protease family)
MTPSLVDWILVAAFAIALPVHGYVTWPRFIATAKANAPGFRVRGYIRVVAVHWALTIAVLAHWWLRERPWDALGLGNPLATPLAWTPVVIVGGLAVFHIRAIAKTPTEELVKAATVMGDIVYLMPRTALERRLFYLVAMTAGACEEIVYRALLPWLLVTFAPAWAAIVIATVLFGLGHAYQGPAGIVKTGIVGAVMALLVLWSGTLWPAIVLHTIVDLHGGAIGGRIARSTG